MMANVVEHAMLPSRRLQKGHENWWEDKWHQNGRWPEIPCQCTVVAGFPKVETAFLRKTDKSKKKEFVLVGRC
jgi:hypothetical protein